MSIENIMQYIVKQQATGEKTLEKIEFKVEQPNTFSLLFTGTNNFLQRGFANYRTALLIFFCKIYNVFITCKQVAFQHHFCIQYDYIEQKISRNSHAKNMLPHAPLSFIYASTQMVVLSLFFQKSYSSYQDTVNTVLQLGK